MLNHVPDLDFPCSDSRFDSKSNDPTIVKSNPRLLCVRSFKAQKRFDRCRLLNVMSHRYIVTLVNIGPIARVSGTKILFILLGIVLSAQAGRWCMSSSTMQAA